MALTAQKSLYCLFIIWLVIWTKITRDALRSERYARYITSARSDLFYEKDGTVDESSINATIVAYVRGEMGNHLMIIAQSFAAKLMAKEFGINAEIVMRHQTSRTVWTRVKDELKQCFPNLRHFNFSEANTELFDRLADTRDPYFVEAGPLDVKKDIAQWKQQLLSTPSPYPTASNVVFPFLKVGSFISESLFQKYYDDIRDFLSFNRELCCLAVPEPDESVFVSSICRFYCFMVPMTLAHLT